ncbi:MAG: glycosyltransferase family 2 protein [Lachnospiraceae bacterium]|nr:glycosyltransferase family 2 protein [Lachnospiraceae bacterium]
MNQVRLALNICTYKREQILRKNLEVLKGSEFYNPNNSHYYNKMEIFVIDNASELLLEEFPNLHLFHNPNTGGSGGFQRGVEEIRKINGFTHVIFMDDDVTFEMSSFYLLYDFLETVDPENADRPVAGRMLDADNPNIQWTAAEKWNAGNIKHVEFLRDITDPANPYTPGKAVYDVDADYGGFWFCCYPYSYVKDNDILPFFLHCDDVEYGLRCGKTPIIIEGVHVWHETWEKKMSSRMLYYDIRNSLLVNQKYGFIPTPNQSIDKWEKMINDFIVEGNFEYAFSVIDAISDFYKGLKYIKPYKKNNNSLFLPRIVTKYKLLKWNLLKLKINETI